MKKKKKITKELIVTLVGFSKDNAIQGINWCQVQS